jgi:hypothetical protein
MPRPALALAALPLVAALAACQSSDAAERPAAASVPAGVAEQYDVLAAEVDEKGMSVESGEWTVNLITEAAEPWHVVHGSGHDTFREPAAGETNHIEIIPVETATGRIIPDVPITLEVVDSDGSVVQEQTLDFYYSTFFHYARNFSVPQPGTYTVRATLGVPTFPRHGEPDEAAPLSEGATVEFENVELGE